jgi:predicted alpha/beta-hydrolase family hydrolase
MTRFLISGPAEAAATILLAHGAGAPMDSAAMDSATQALAAAGLRVARFEFDYMAARRSGARKPPPRAESLQDEYLAALDALPKQHARGDGGSAAPLIIGGKSMGGRVASMIADRAFAEARIAGLLCLGYPFHPVGKPERLRTAHLAALRVPALIVQGTRDPFGTPEEVAGYTLSPAIELLWLEDGDHDLKPRKSVSGHTAADHLRRMAERVAAWSRGLVPPQRADRKPG